MWYCVHWKTYCVPLGKWACTFTQVTFLWLMKRFRPDIKLLVEQPTSSFMFKMPSMVAIANSWELERCLTHLGVFGHDLLKATHLLGNWCEMSLLARTATAKVKEAHRKRIESKRARQLAKGQQPKEYWKKLSGPGNRFQGGANLAESAVYPQRFATAICNAWSKADSKRVVDEQNASS